MPYDYDNVKRKYSQRWPIPKENIEALNKSRWEDDEPAMFGVAQAVEGHGDEVEIVVSKEHMAALEKALKDTDLGFNASIFKQTADSFKAFATAEKVPNVEEEEVPNHWAHVRSQEMLVHYPRSANQAGRYDNDHTVNPGWLNYHNVKDLLARFFVTVHANYGKVRNWRELCIGITSLDHESGHLPMFDYDGKNIKTRVKKDVKQLQKQFGLGDAAIYETRRGLHVYFFSDLVEQDQYTEMLNSVNCCKGFKRSFERSGYAVLRVSAKYTEFDILPYKVIISPNRGATRPGRKAALIQELLRLGQECGTHFASLYPQWGQYQEDMTPWKVGGKNRPGRRVKKVSKEAYYKKQEMMKMKKMKKDEAVEYKMTFTEQPMTTWANTASTTITTSNQYYVKTSGGTYK